MDGQYVNSSNLRWVCWEKYPDSEEIGRFQIAFESGRIYEYENVPDSVYKGFFEVADVGVYFNTEVKGVYGYERLQ